MVATFLAPVSLNPRSKMIATSLSPLLLRLQFGIRGACPAATCVANTIKAGALRRNGDKHRKINQHIFYKPSVLHGHSRAPMATVVAATSDVLPAAGGSSDDGGALKAGGGEDEEEGKESKETMVLPSQLSPSSVAAFKQCRKLFFYRYIMRYSSASTPEQVRGIAVHEVLSRFFDLPHESRDISHVHELFRGVMQELIEKERQDGRLGYSGFFTNRDEERAWAITCLDLIANFLYHERKNPPEQGDPEQREMKLTHTFLASYNPLDASKEGMAETARAPSSHMSVIGIIDRLDRCADGSLRVVDYKTGKAPELKYSEKTNQRIMDEKFFQLQIYALLVQRELGEVPKEMRIVYLQEPTSVTRSLDSKVLPEVERELRSVWEDIVSAVERERFPPKPGPLCDWCSFQDRCPAFN